MYPTAAPEPVAGPTPVAEPTTPSYPPPPYQPQYGPPPSVYRPVYPTQYEPLYGPPPVVPPPRRGQPVWWIAGAAVSAVLVVAVVASLLTSHRAPGTDPAVAPTAPRDLINAALARQGTALAGNDQAGWLAAVDPAQKALVAKYRQRFTALRSLSASSWTATVTASPAQGADRAHWTATADVSFCLGAPSCAAAKGTHGVDPAERLRITLQWRLVGATALIVAETAVVNPWTKAKAADPWLLAPLVYATGTRVIVAAPAGLRSHLAATVTAADRAAANADLFNPGRHPARYVVYLAAKTEWAAWFGGTEPPWAGAYTRRISPGDASVVVNTLITPTDFLSPTLRHELGHVVTIGPDYANQWWVTEGVAEYIDTWNIAVSHYARLADVRRYLHSHVLVQLAFLAPAGKDPDWVVDADYGIAGMAIRHLADAYGRAQTLGFVDDVESGHDLDVVAQQHFGADWASVQRSTLSYIRHTALA